MAFLRGLGILGAVGLVLCAPLLVAAPFLGWDDALRWAAVFWLAAPITCVIVVLIYYLGAGEL